MVLVSHYDRFSAKYTLATYKIFLDFNQKVLLKGAGKSGKSLGTQNTIKVFCNPSEKVNKRYPPYYNVQ